MTYRVVVYRRARSDVRAIFDWLAERSSSGALRWRQAFDEMIERLETNPLGFARIEEADDLIQRNLRQILFKTRGGRIYRAIFVVLGNHVHVLRVRGPGQPPITDEDL